jgi:SAM-dependent methyltransferase
MITLTHKNVNFSFSWSNFSELKKYVSFQHGFDSKLPDDVFLQKLTNKIQSYCDIYLRFIPVNSKKIISVGSGASTFELILSKYCIDSKIFLLDKSEIILGFGEKENSFSESNSQGFYNSWEVVHDAIKTSNLNSNSFAFLDPEDDWDEDIDVVISLASWCWHYPFEFYADKLLKSLKIGGSLILEIQNTPDFRDVPKLISELLGSDPAYQERYPHTPNCRLRKNVDLKNEEGGLYVWVRKK